MLQGWNMLSMKKKPSSNGVSLQRLLPCDRAVIMTLDVGMPWNRTLSQRTMVTLRVGQ